MLIVPMPPVCNQHGENAMTPCAISSISATTCPAQHWGSSLATPDVLGSPATTHIKWGLVPSGGCCLEIGRSSAIARGHKCTMPRSCMIASSNSAHLVRFVMWQTVAEAFFFRQTANYQWTCIGILRPPPRSSPHDLLPRKS